MRPNHNIPSGPVSQCQICGNPDLRMVIDLGYQPLCDTLLSPEELLQPEVTYPLSQLWCPKCTLSQMGYVVPGEVVYHEAYPYRTGVTRELTEYQDAMAESIVSELKLQSTDLVVDVGCNDGTLLKAFQKRHVRVAGVEPTGIARYAREAGLDTFQAPFDSNVAKQILSSHGHAKVVTATNVFAHMASLGDVMEGLELLVASDGFFILENHYLEPIMERLQFDTVYHEHVRTYSLLSLVTLFDYYDFKVVHAEKVSRYGGNIRVYVAKGKNVARRSSVDSILAEEARKFTDPDYYDRFRQRSFQLKNDLLELALRCHRNGKTLIGNSCPGRCSTLLNFAGIGPDLMPYIAEQPTSLKLGKFLPGMRIPIVNNQRLIDEQPENVLLLAWHFAQPIGEQLRARGLRSTFYVPMPEVKVMDV